MMNYSKAFLNMPTLDPTKYQGVSFWKTVVPFSLPNLETEK